MNNLRDRLIAIIVETFDFPGAVEYLTTNDDLTQIGLNSLNFIKMIIGIEKEFGVEVDDESLDFTKFTSYALLCQYVENLVNAAGI